MAKVHDDADIWAAAQEIVREKGEGALSRASVIERLKDRAEGRGQGRVGVQNIAAQRVVNALRDELAGKRRLELNSSPSDPSVLALPDGLQAALSRHVQDVEGIVREAISETLRQAELSAQARLRQVESDAADSVKRLESALWESRVEGEEAAGQLDEAESALAVARAQIQELTALAHSSREALSRVEGETRSQMAAGHAALQNAFEATSRAEEAAHKSEIARVATAEELDRTRQELARVRKECDERVAAADRAEGRARDAERLLDVSRGVLATLQEERERLVQRLESVLANPARVRKSRSRSTPSAANAE